MTLDEAEMVVFRALRASADTDRVALIRGDAPVMAFSDPDGCTWFVSIGHGVNPKTGGTELVGRGPA